MSKNYLMSKLEQIDLKLSSIDGVALCVDLSMNSGFDATRLHNAITGLSNDIKEVSDEVTELLRELAKTTILNKDVSNEIDPILSTFIHVASDEEFMKLPLQVQAAFFHLLARADKDGKVADFENILQELRGYNFTLDTLEKEVEEYLFQEGLIARLSDGTAQLFIFNM